MVVGLLLALTLQAPDFAPNYADSLLTPYEGSQVEPKLFPARRSNLVKVAVDPDSGLVTDDRLQLVILACERWSTATEGQPRAFTFQYIESHGQVHPDVIIRFSAERPDGTKRGRTEEVRGTAFTRLAVVDADGKALPAKEVLRVATHEMGHALGIWGHSPNPKDMMSLSEDVDQISVADVNTLELAYLRNERPFRR